jgi:UDP-N-acetylmuramoyl-tripeptide--D-alanyl-D-alanine ligase
MRNLSLKEIIHLLEKNEVGTNKQTTGFSVDSRTLQSGEVYCALSGNRVDGHSFLGEASAKNAAGAIVSHNFEGDSFGLPLIKVENVLSSLQKIAKKILARTSQQVIGVTGSVGKTTTKDFIHGLLKTKFKVAASPGNSNSQVGLPLAILNHTMGNEQILVLEMGMTFRGEIEKLIQIAPPDIAVITSTSLVHACNFDSIESIALAKSEIFQSPRTRWGILDYNVNNFNVVSKVGPCTKLTFSLISNRADYHLEVQNDHLVINENGSGISRITSYNLPGTHNRHNFLAAVVVARNLGMDWEDINIATRTLQLPKKRLERVEKNGATFINDSYNASMISVKAAIESLPEPKQGGKKIAVIGEMLELGNFSKYCHEEVGKYALDHVDTILCLGVETKAIIYEWEKAKKPAQWFSERMELVCALRKILKPGDVVLLKGSRSKGMWNILDEL